MRNTIMTRAHLLSAVVCMFLIGCGGGSRMTQNSESVYGDSVKGNTNNNYNEYEDRNYKKQAMPECNEDDSRVHIIDSNEDWERINDEEKSIFCIKPGDYSDLGRIEITAKANPEKPRYILLHNGNDIHPAKLKKEQLAKYLLELKSADYWIVDRQAYWEAEKSTEHNRLTNSSHNRFYRGYFTDTYSAFYIAGGDGNTIEKWHIEKTKWSVNNNIFEDIAAINLVCSNDKMSTKNTKIIDNEIINHIDAIQLVRIYDAAKKGAKIDFSGTEIRDNLMYVNPTIYTGNNESLSENAIDLKGGSLNPSKPIVISNNIMFGFRKSSNKYKLRDIGAAVVSHQEVQNIIFEKNIIFDSSYGFVSDNPLNDKPAFYKAKIYGNLFYNIINDAFVFEGSKKKGIYDSARNVKFEKNIFDSISKRAIIIYNSEDVDIKNNKIDAVNGIWFYENDETRKSKNLAIKDNTFFDALKEIPEYAESSNNILGQGEAKDSWSGKRVYKIKKFTKNPEFRNLF